MIILSLIIIIVQKSNIHTQWRQYGVLGVATPQILGTRLVESQGLVDGLWNIIISYHV